MVLKFYLATKKDTWEQHPANLIPPLTTKHASALSVDGTPSLARCRDRHIAYSPRQHLKIKKFPADDAGCAG